MPAKKAKKSPRSIRYVLSADRRLQRLSLRKMTERIKMPNPASRAARLKTAASATDFANTSRRKPFLMSSRAIVLAAICVIGAAALIAARQPSHESDVARVDARLADRNAPPETAPTPTRVEPKKVVVDARPPAAAAVVTAPPAVPMVKTPVAEPVNATTEPAPKPAAVDSTKETEVKSEAAATITGCLESDSAKQTFWLSDTAGDTPKSRSWRSGFLKKRPSRIELVDAPSLRLASHVGQRVIATGTLENREMRASSLRRVAASCN